MIPDRHDYRRAYRLCRQCEQGDQGSMTAVAALIRSGIMVRAIFRARLSLLDRRTPDPLCRPMHLRMALR